MIFAILLFIFGAIAIGAIGSLRRIGNYGGNSWQKLEEEDIRGD